MLTEKQIDRRLALIEPSNLGDQDKIDLCLVLNRFETGDFYPATPERLPKWNWYDSKVCLKRARWAVAHEGKEFDLSIERIAEIRKKLKHTSI